MASNWNEQSPSVKDKARDASEHIGEKAREMSQAAGRRADEATEAVGGGMQSLAGTLREHGPEAGVVGSAKSALADTLESSGRYLQEQGLKGVSDDLTEVIRRNPIPALLIGIGLGYLLARATRS